MHEPPRDKHRWLQRLAGDWTFEIEAAMAPGQPTTTQAGTEHVRSLGGLWAVCEGRMELPEGKDATSIMTLGFDPERGRFVGTFISSAMSHLWLYDGTLDPAADALTLDSEGPSFETEGATARYEDTIRFEGKDRRVLTSRYLGSDGEWHDFMTSRYERVM